MPTELDDAQLDTHWRRGLRALAEPGDASGIAERIEQNQRARRRRHRALAAVATAACVLAAVGVVALTSGGGSKGQPIEAGRGPVRPAPGRFTMRPVVTTSPAPCRPAQLPGRGSTAHTCYTLGLPALDGSDVVSAEAQTVNGGDAVAIDIQLTPTGLARLERVARATAGAAGGNAVAFVVDGQVVAAPELVGGDYRSGISVQGDWSLAEAKRIAAAIGLPPAVPTPASSGAASVITNPCRFFTSTDAARVLGPTARAEPIGTASACSYLNGAGTRVALQMWRMRLRLPAPGVVRCVGECPSSTVAVSPGRAAESTPPRTTRSLPPGVAFVVERVDGIGDHAVWLDAGAGGQLEVQAGPVGIRLTVGVSSNDKQLAEDVARSIVGNLHRTTTKN